MREYKVQGIMILHHLGRSAKNKMYTLFAVGHCVDGMDIALRAGENGDSRRRPSLRVRGI